jgi:hypothetical protein
MAEAYGYRAHDSEIYGVVSTALSGGQDRETGLAEWKNRLQKYAQAKYSAFADRIASGETVLDIAKPYMDVYAQTLEINPNTVKLDDPLLQRALQGTPHEAGKPPVAQAVWQFQEHLRQDPRWGYTNNAMQAAAKAATHIGKAFGMIA